MLLDRIPYFFRRLKIFSCEFERYYPIRWKRYDSDNIHPIIIIQLWYNDIIIWYWYYL